MHSSISFLLNQLSRNRRFSYKKIMLIPKSLSLQVLYYISLIPSSYQPFFINHNHPNYVVSRVHLIMHTREIFICEKMHSKFHLVSVDYPLNMIFFPLKNIKKNFANTENENYSYKKSTSRDPLPIIRDPRK